MKRQGCRQVVGDPNHVLFFNRHEAYRVSHPVEGGDDCTVFTFRSDILLEALATFQRVVKEQQPFSFAHALNSQRTFLLHQRIRQILIANRRDALMIEEASLNLLGSVLAETCRNRCVQRSSPRTGTVKAHREKVQATRLFLAARFSENLPLEQIAVLMHISPFHLARIFRRETGLSIHQYRNRLRLRAALERIQEGAGDLTGLALDVGYSSHSHLTDAFRRSFGLAPSDCRRVSSGRLAELSRNLEAANDRPN